MTDTNRHPQRQTTQLQDARPRQRIRVTLFLLCLAATIGWPPNAGNAATLTAEIVDADTGAPLAARVYVQDEKQVWRFVDSASSQGSALPYREQWVPMPGIVEHHTTVSAHGFKLEVEPGSYEITVRRGKEYRPWRRKIVVEGNDVRIKISLQRFVDLAKLGWYSGETHVHRRIQELPNVQVAEDLNVSFPVTYWTVKSGEAPGLQPSPLRRQGPSPFGPRRDAGSDLIEIDKTHVIFPRNTEYEIFSVGEKRHVLGAVFILNHKSRFTDGAPPIAPIAERAHREGALLDLDKHSWPWSMMLAPVAKVDLYELANNSLWMTRFGFRRSGKPPAYMKIEADEGGMTEMGWIQYGFKNYYALLNCGFPLKPTAGTASGVHPVPLGFSRVYVHVGDNFSGDAWIQGLKAGRSFVTTEPILLATIDGQHPGAKLTPNSEQKHEVSVKVHSPRPITRVEIVVNGEVVQSLTPKAKTTPEGAFLVEWNTSLPITRTSWVAVRAFRVSGERVRFAHTAPWYVQLGDQPLRPTKDEIEFLIDNVKGQIERNRGVISPAALAEFEKALAIYQAIAKRVPPK